LGISLYTRTQLINCPHPNSVSQFGYSLKFNEFGSFIVSAPTGNRFISTSFDQTDDENFNNDTIFDNNTTKADGINNNKVDLADVEKLTGFKFK
jgi:hypothetical protein